MIQQAAEAKKIEFDIMKVMNVEVRSLLQKHKADLEAVRALNNPKLTDNADKLEQIAMTISANTTKDQILLFELALVDLALKAPTTKNNSNEHRLEMQRRYRGGIPAEFSVVSYIEKRYREPEKPWPSLKKLLFPNFTARSAATADPQLDGDFPPPMQTLGRFDQPSQFDSSRPPARTFPNNIGPNGGSENS